jgi:sphingolipid delta-4 desaturase
MASEDFSWTETRDPHLARRKKILAQHPEISKLFGPDPRIALVVLAIVSFQLTLAWFAGSMHWAVFIALAYVVGSTLQHTLYLAIHEITHDLAFRSPTLNNFLAIFANLPLVIPFAMPFRRYHALHHWQMGVDGVDMDIPSDAEAKTFKGTIGKFLWLTMQIVFYAIRPLFVNPLGLDKWMIFGIIVQFSFVAVLLDVGGFAPVGFLLLSVFFSGGLNPTAGHFIAEHYEFEPGQETYSYYGPANKITFNVGYHNEHHDFPNVPGSRLPQVRRIAGEFYDELYSYSSWSSTLVRFITDPKVSLWSRVKRKPKVQQEAVKTAD